MDNNLSTSHDRHHQGFNKSTGLIAAVANLLTVATESAGSKLASSLDDTTLLTIANTLYQEALVAESLYIQLEDIHQQTVAKTSSIYNCYPQILIPLNRMSIQQLEDARQEAFLRIETLRAYSDSNEVDSNSEPEITSLVSAIANIEQELAKR